MLSLLRRLRDQGNTVVVVEHDVAAIRQADFMLELGPGAKGGKVVYAGPVEGSARSLTGAYLTGEKKISVPSAHADVRVLPGWASGGTLHNLANVDADIPLGTLTAVTRVSSDRARALCSTTLYPGMRPGSTVSTAPSPTSGNRWGDRGFERLRAGPGCRPDRSESHRAISRSNPITYIRAFDEVRELFASQPEARRRKYTAAIFVQPRRWSLRGVRRRRSRPGGDGLPR